MLADLDETIREFLIRYAPLETSEVDISFETPDRDWSSRLSRPTVNCFLFDVRENHDLRQTGFDVTRENGAYVRRKEPIRFDVTYQVSVWAQAAEDEHRLLWHVLGTLARHAMLPEDTFQGEVQVHPLSIPTRVAQPNDGPRNSAELWQAIDNRVRPSIPYIVTVALDPNVVSAGRLVLSRTTSLTPLPERDRLPDSVNPDLVDPRFTGRRLLPDASDTAGTPGAAAVSGAARANGASASTAVPSAPDSASPATGPSRTGGTGAPPTRPRRGRGQSSNH